MISPPTVDKFVEKLLNRIDSEYEPEIVKIHPEPYAKKSNCFPNVAEKVKKDGGTIRYGWALLADNLIYEAEWHAVWEDLNENLIDITPREEGDNEIMFVPVDDINYKGQFIDNVRVNITNNPIVDHFILICESTEFLLSKADRINDEEISIPPKLQLPVKMFASFRYQLLTYIETGAKITSPCYCKSGKKYKACHGQNFEINIKNRMKQILFEISSE